MAFGQLILAATPIGNAEDATDRVRRLLAESDVVAAEDTRKVLALARRLELEIRGRIVSFHEHNEAGKADRLLDEVDAGHTVVVVTDAGMPSMSDPGYRLVERALERKVPFTVAPGPSAILTALVLSGLPTDRFAFEGFVPRKTGERLRALRVVASDTRTLVFFEAPHRIAQTITDMGAVFGSPRRAAICREMTKTFEEVLRGTLGELAQRVAVEPLRGEIVVVVAGAPENAEADIDTLVEQAQSRVAAGERLGDVASELASQHEVSRRELYNAVLQRAPRPC